MQGCNVMCVGRYQSYSMKYCGQRRMHLTLRICYKLHKPHLFVIRTPWNVNIPTPTSAQHVYAVNTAQSAVAVGRGSYCGSDNQLQRASRSNLVACSGCHPKPSECGQQLSESGWLQIYSHTVVSMHHSIHSPFGTCSLLSTPADQH